ncbi:MAG: alpha/beta fold hydrolase [Solirubrobacteraceae bacterium]
MSTRVNVSGIEDRVVLAGSQEQSEAVVFVHGNPGSADDWERLALACAAKGLRAVAPDMPDFGETPAPDGFEHTVAGYATFLDHALQTLGVQRAHLVLHDFGGPFGLVWAATRPERLASVTLIDTGILPGYRWHRMARIWRTPVIGELSQALMFRSGFRRALAAAEPKGLPREFMDRMYDQYDRRTRKAVLALYRSADDPGAAGAEFAAWMAPRDIPALVIWGEGDAYLPSAFAVRQRDAFPSAEVHVLAGSGHGPFADAPETVQRLFAGFLQRVRGAGA